MSWYSVIYVYVRQFRAKNPLVGYLLHLLLNSLLVIQIVITFYTYYVYIYLMCLQSLHSLVQSSIYLFVHFSIVLMMTWSLVMTEVTPVARVPEVYYVEVSVDKALKKVTPFAKGRYVPDQSSTEQVEQQNQILIKVVEAKRLLFAETDHFGRIRYCYQCNLLKPDRCHHCSSCGFCVVKFDHHCPWINKCVSYNNYKYFNLYVFYAVLLVFWTLTTSFEAVVRYFIDQHWAEDAPKFVQIVMMMIVYGVFGYFPLGELLIYHYKLITLNETTCEQAKIPIIRGDFKADYNFGRVFNFRAVFGWGLWLFPVFTSTIDGLHFPVKYTKEANREDQLCIRPVDRNIELKITS